MEKIVCIYKIVSPSKKTYIGQTVNYKKRYSNYKCLSCPNQVRLYRSLVKYGFDKHEFEILHICEVDDLNRLERHYQDLYDVMGSKGLNCKLVSSEEKPYVISEQTKRKISKANKGRKVSEESKLKMALSRKKIKSTMSLEARKRLSDRMMGNKYYTLIKNTEFRNRRASEVHKGNTYAKGIIKTEESKKLMSIKMSGKNHPMYGKKHTEQSRKNMSIGGKYRNIKIVLNTETGIYYQGTREAAYSCAMNRRTLIMKLSGHRKNTTPFIYA